MSVQFSIIKCECRLDACAECETFLLLETVSYVTEEIVSPGSSTGFFRLDFSCVITVSNEDAMYRILVNTICHTNSQNQMAVPLPQEIVDFQGNSYSVQRITAKSTRPIGIRKSYIIP